MDRPFSPERHSWRKKFAYSFRGCYLGFRGDNSFLVHLPAAVLVVAAALYWRLPVQETCLLILCITVVLAAELMNSSIESLAKAVIRIEDPHVAQALDIASAAVLCTTLGAAVVGLIILLPRLVASVM